MSTIIVTTAYLGDKKNLKTAGISPVVDALAEEEELKQLICQVHKNYYFPKTYSASPVLYRYAMRIFENVFHIKLRKFRKRCLDTIASWMLQKSDVVILHPAGSFKRTLKKAKKQRSVTMGIATVAHPSFDEALHRAECEKFGVSFASEGQFNNAQFVVNSLDYVIAYSDFVKDSYLAHGFPPERIFVAYSDIPLPTEIPVRKAGAKFSVLFLAHITPRKGLHYLLEAWDALGLTDAELVIVGGYGGERYTPPEFKEYCDEIIARNENIKWVGVTKEADKYYREASLFVLPSLSEGNPKVVMEAMSHGLPIITTENAQSVVEDGRSGYVLPIRDVEGIKEKIMFFYENREEMIKMGVTARETMENKTPFGEAVLDMVNKVA